MKFYELLVLFETAEQKSVKKIRGSVGNTSYKCEKISDFRTSLMKIIGELKYAKFAAILDIENSIAYIVGRDSFHSEMANTWNIPYDSSSDNFLILTATYSEGRPIQVDKLSMSKKHQKSLDDLKAGWLKRVFLPE